MLDGTSKDLDRFFVGQNAAIQKCLEQLIGYPLTPKQLHDIYTENEFVADEDLKGKPILMTLTVSQIKKDMLGTPFLDVEVDNSGLASMYIYLDKKDPFLRRLKKGSVIGIVVYPRGLVMNVVNTDGRIITDQEFYLDNGKLEKLPD